MKLPPLPPLSELREKAKSALERLRTSVALNGDTLRLYNAGLQGDSVRFGLFGRDLLLTALMLREPSLLRDALIFVFKTLGKRYDPCTGEEPGRGLHEYARVEIRGLLTHYDACDVSPLLWIAADAYHSLTGDRDLLSAHERGLAAALRYVLSRIRDGLYEEDPSRCGAERYALRATYWKDSRLPGREDPQYPVTYTLVQAQTIAALRSAASLAAQGFSLGESVERLRAHAQEMVEALWTKLWDDGRSFPAIALDGHGKVRGIASDGLHLLAYLQPEDVPPGKLGAIEAGARALETPYGYRTYAPGEPHYDPRSYHWGSIWPFEQYFIARGALLHEREGILEVALRVLPALRRLGFVEAFAWEEGQGGELHPIGCDLQLWTAALPQAFARLLEPLLEAAPTDTIAP